MEFGSIRPAFRARNVITRGRSFDIRGRRTVIRDSRDGVSGSAGGKKTPTDIVRGRFCPIWRSLVLVRDRAHVDRSVRPRLVLLHRDDLRRSFGTRRLIGRDVRDAEHDAAMDGIDFHHPQVELHRLVHEIRRRLHVLAARVELRQRDEALDVVADVHHDALVHQAHDGARQLHADRIVLADLEPRILLGLLEPEADALVLGVDVQDHDVDRVALLHDFRRMLNALRPAHVGNVNQAVDPRLDFDEGAEAGQVAHLSIDPRADRIPLRQHHPRILLRLLHAERDLLFAWIDLEHHRLDRLADAHELRRVTHIAGPAHLADVHQAFDPRLQLDERAVVGDRHDLARDAGADRILLGDILPRIRMQLLQPEANALPGPIDIEDLDLELLADLHHLRRMGHASPRHVGDVQQAVHAAEVDERTEVGDVLDHAFARLVDLELLHQLFALARPLVLENDTTRDDDVAATLVELDDLELELLAEQLVDVRNAAERDLRAWEERVDAHEVDDHPALDLLDQRAFDRLIRLVRDADSLPHAHEVGFRSEERRV